MAVFVMSDTHLSLACNKPMDKFGGRWENHAEKINTRWRAIVGADDTVVIPGDISWEMKLPDAETDLRFLDDLPGKKIILKGNHDFWWETMKKLETFCSEKNLSTLSFLHNDAVRAENIIVCGSRGWYSEGKTVITPNSVDTQKIVAREVGRVKTSLEKGRALHDRILEEEGLDAELVTFLHFPPYFDGYVCEDIVTVLEEFGVRRCYFGHIHGSYQNPPYEDYRGIRFYLVSADYLDFYPVPIF